MMTNKNKPTKKQPAPSLVVTVEFNPSKNDITNFIQAASIEFFGTWLENKIETKTKKSMVILFEKNAFGEEFYKMVENTNLKVLKEEI